MAKLNKKSTSKVNCKSNNDKKRRSAYFKRQQKFKRIQQERKGSSNNGSLHQDTSALSVQLCDSDHFAECGSQVENNNRLQCSSDLDLSSMNHLVDPVVDSYECITIEDDSTYKSSELKNASQKRHKQVYPYLSTSLKQQCDSLSENDELSQNMILIKTGFEEDLKILQDGIQSQISHGRRHRINSDFYFNAIKRLNNNCYIKQLLKEKKELDEELKNAKKKLNRKRDLIVHKISLVQSVYCTIKELIKFSMHQRKVIQFKVKWMKNVKNKLSKRDRKVFDIPNNEATTFLPEESFPNQPHMGCQKINEEEVATNVPFLPREFSVNQLGEEMVFDDNIINSEVHTEINQELLISDNPPPIELRNEELSDAKEKALMLLEQLKSTQDELQKVRKEMNEQVSSIQQNADCEQKKMMVQLSEIKAMLKEKVGSTTKIVNILENNSNGVTSQSILWDIRWLVEECAHFKVNTVTENNTDNSITSDAVRVTENEVHLLILIAFFLKVIPFLVTTEFIHTYLKNIDNSLSLQFVTNLLNKFPTVFRGESVGAGSLEKKWCYLSLSPVITI